MKRIGLPHVPKPHDQSILFAAMEMGMSGADLANYAALAEVKALKDLQERGKKTLSTLDKIKNEIDQRAGRNNPCPCGSGKKFKKCCLNPDPTEILERQG